MANEKVLKSKQEEVEKLAEKMKKAKIVLLTDYRGITVEDDTKLRSELRKVNAEYIVIKNNITRRAAAQNNIEGLDEFCVGPTALILGYDEYLEPSKAIYNYSKENDFYKLKAGIMDEKIVSAEHIITLAKLPSREVLLTKLAGVLLANINNLAVVLDQVRQQKEA